MCRLPAPRHSYPCRIGNPETVIPKRMPPALVAAAAKSSKPGLPALPPSVGNVAHVATLFWLSGHARGRHSPSAVRLTMNSTRNTKNSIFAMPAAFVAKTPKPKTAATTAMSRNASAHDNITTPYLSVLLLFFQVPFFHCNRREVQDTQLPVKMSSTSPAIGSPAIGSPAIGRYLCSKQASCQSS